MTSHLLDDLADYAIGNAPLAGALRGTACLCLMDALACAVGATQQKPALLGNLFGETLAGTTRILGTALGADPVKAAFDMSMLIRWMDFSDTSVLGGHPSDNIGAILSAAQHQSERQLLEGGHALTMDDVARALRSAYEIQGCLCSNDLKTTAGRDANRAVGTGRSVEKATGQAAPWALFLKGTFCV